MKRRWKYIIPTIFITALLSGCAPFKSEDFTSRIFFNVWDLLVIFLAFIVLLVVVFYFGYKPVKNMIKKRHEYVEGQIKEAENREKETRVLKEEAAANINTSKKEALKIIEDAKVLANKEKEQIIEEARIEANNEKDKAKKDIEREIEASKDKLHKEIVDVALVASEELLGREVNDEDNRRLVDDFINNIEKENK